MDARPSADYNPEAPKNGAARSGACNTGSGPDHQPRCDEVTALANSKGESARVLDEQFGNTGAAGATVAALRELVGAMRDNVFLEPWAVDELLDMQPSNEHAKALLVALGIHELIPDDETADAMRRRGLGAL